MTHRTICVRIKTVTKVKQKLRKGEIKMATNWSAYDAAKELYGNNKELISEIGSRFPLFTRTVCLANDEYLLDILKAIQKVTARVVETGLKEMDGETAEDQKETEVQETETPKAEKKKEKAPKKAEKKVEESEDDFEEDDAEQTYESMTAKDLYKLCCERGISNKVASRKKTDLIDALEKFDRGEMDQKTEEPDDDSWDDEEEETNPYKGKSAKELYKMCMDRKIKTKPRMSADKYAELLMAEDEKKAKAKAKKQPEPVEDDDEDDDWEI